MKKRDSQKVQEYTSVGIVSVLAGTRDTRTTTVEAGALMEEEEQEEEEANGRVSRDTEEGTIVVGPFPRLPTDGSLDPKVVDGDEYGLEGLCDVILRL